MQEAERLESILRDPALASPEEARRVLTQVSQAVPLLAQRALASDDMLIDLDHAAEIVDRSPRWLRENAAKLPFMCKVGEEWRCSRLKIQTFIRERGSK